MPRPDVQLHSNGAYWQASWFDEQGRRQKRGLGSKRKITRVDAMGMCSKIAAALALEAEGGLPTIAGLYDRVAFLKAENKPGSMVLIAAAVELFATWADTNLSGGRSTRIDAITKTLASEYRAWLQAKGPTGELGRTMGPVTIQRHIRNLRTCWNTIAETLEDATLLNPWARRGWKLPKVSRDWAEISHDDLRAMMAATDHIGVRRMLALCRWAGLRAGEARRLRWCDVSLDERRLTVLPAADRTGARIEGTKQAMRHVPIRPELAEVLVRPAGEAPTAPVCPDLPSPNNLRRMLVGEDVKQGRRKRDGTPRRYIGILEKAGLPVYAKPLHTLRRNCGTEWAERVPLADLAKWMGHSPQVAADYYLRTTPTTWASVTGVEIERAPKPAPNRTAAKGRTIKTAAK